MSGIIGPFLDKKYKTGPSDSGVIYDKLSNSKELESIYPINKHIIYDRSSNHWFEGFMAGALSVTVGLLVVIKHWR